MNFVEDPSVLIWHDLAMMQSEQLGCMTYLDQTQHCPEHVNGLMTQQPLQRQMLLLFWQTLVAASQVDDAIVFLAHQVRPAKEMV
jgi:hypothetical protein